MKEIFQMSSIIINCNSKKNKNGELGYIVIFVC